MCTRGMGGAEGCIAHGEIKRFFVRQSGEHAREQARCSLLELVPQRNGWGDDRGRRERAPRTMAPYRGRH